MNEWRPAVCRCMPDGVLGLLQRPTIAMKDKYLVPQLGAPYDMSRVRSRPSCTDPRPSSSCGVKTVQLCHGPAAHLQHKVASTTHCNVLGTATAVG